MTMPTPEEFLEFWAASNKDSDGNEDKILAIAKAMHADDKIHKMFEAYTIALLVKEPCQIFGLLLALGFTLGCEYEQRKASIAELNRVYSELNVR